jgi:hypothetical protein
MHMRTIGKLGIVALVVMGLVAGMADARARRRSAAASTSAKVRILAKSVAVGVGWQWGDGTLTWRGKSYPFKIEGLSINALGASKSDAWGDVYDLKALHDFEGTYTAIEASGTLGGGKGITSMKNGNGVRMTLHWTTQGIEVKAAPEGIKITLE